MPRHTGPALGYDHVHLPPEQRRPVLPRRTTATPVWVVDNYRVRSWYYKAAPAIGDTVRYMDGSLTHVVSISATKIVLANSLGMRRPYQTARLITWATTTLNRKLTYRFGLGTAHPQMTPHYATNLAS